MYISTGTGATAANSIIKITDTAAHNTTISVTPANNVILYTAPAGTTIKGVAFSPASPSMALSAAHPVASNINQGSADNIIGGIACAVTASSATLNAVTVNTAGTYSTSDLTNIKFWFNPTENSLTGATQLGSNQAAVASGNSVGVSGLSQNIAVGTTGYILVTASISGTATLANTIRLASTSFDNLTFAIGTKTGTNPVAAGANDQTISQVTPLIALANGTIGAASINQNTTNNVLYRADFTVTDANAVLESAAFTTAGSYIASDITNLKLWYATNATFNSGTATLLATKTSSIGAGLQSFSGLSQSVAIGTGYLYLTADVPCYATIGATINVTATATTDFTFASGTPTGSVFTAGGAQTISAGTTTPSNVATNTSVGNGTAGQINAVWTAPATGCYDEIMVVASTATISGTPTGDGSLYTANAAFTSGTAFGGGFVMYKGTTSPQTLTGFTNGTSYFIKIFTRYNSTWSAGTEVSARAYTISSLTEVVIPQYMQGVNGTNNNRIPTAYCVTLTGLTANATYRYNNQPVISTDSATSSGAGNIIYVGATQSANFVQTSTPGLSTAGTYGTFTANSSGSYTGWFITEPTGNATRFVPGNQVFFRILLNDGNNGTLVDRIATTTSSSTVINLVNAAGANNGTAIRSTSLANAKDFVCLYDNTAGTGRPLAATFIENDGNGSVGSYPSFLTTSVNGVAGAWGTIIPNTLANGVRRIETRAFANGGDVICSATDADGIWTTGSINTVNPAGGTAEIVISNTDAGLNCSSVILDHTGITQTTASTENLNSTDNIVSNFRVNASNFATTLNSISFTVGGTFVAGNVANFKLFTSTSTSFPGGTALSTVNATALASGSTITFTGLAQACAVGNRYFWIIADFGLTGSGNTIIIPALGNAAFTFASNATIDTNAIATGGTVTLGILEPSIALSSATIAAANVNDGTVNNVIYRANVAVTVTSASLTSATFTTSGTYVPADVTNFKLWYSTSSTFATNTSTLLATKTTLLDAGVQTFSSFAQTIPTGTAYLYLTTDLPCATTIGNTISVNAIADTDLTFTLGTPTGSGSASGTQTIVASTPSNATGLVATAVGLVGQVSVEFVLPATGCYDEIMIVVAPASNSGTPTGDGSAYTSTLNFTTGSVLGNGRVVYKGTTSPQTVTGLTTGTAYSFKIFTRNGSLWSAGTTDVVATPTVSPALTEVFLPQFIQGNASTNTNRIPYAYRATLSNLLPNATYRYYNSVVATTELATSNGAGNCIFATQSGNFIRTTSPGLSSAGSYATFTTDNTGSYTGWFITEPSGNATRFTPGTSVKMRIILNDGGVGTTIATRLTTTNTVTAINLGTTGANVGTAIRGTSYATPKNFVMLWDNTAGTGRPISGTTVESDGVANTTANSYASFYSTSVEGVAGAWGTIIPNTLANGVRRIQQFGLSDGSGTVGTPATDTNGIWPSGVNTISPSSGATALVVSITEAPLTLVTQLRDNFCGKTFRFLNEIVQCNPVAGATQYRFEVTDEANVVRVVTSGNFTFNPAAFTFDHPTNRGFNWAKNYSFRVALFIDGTWLAYGPSCTARTPNEPTVLPTKLRSPWFCNQTVASMNTNIQCDPVHLATNYEFRITGPEDIIKQGLQHLSLSILLLFLI
ncbi:beta strand repeat-containing protein [Flavobacterium myungsuense]|uniref:beta strand repeat-containing protein n=1 Tax=Flavobacterium myungsuense TaxID=651823 RepID=UPI003625CAA1